jgi:hypothetical protein
MLIMAAACRRASTPESAPPPAGGYGTVRGRIRLAVPPPPPEPIRMNADPMCRNAHEGRTMVQEAVVTGADGSLANVFVRLQGDFPDHPAPAAPVTIDQRGCIYTPRVVGLQLGQPLRVANSDPGLHNVHGVSTEGDGFNIGQPLAGLTNTFHPQHEGILRLQCDVHVWMFAFVGVVKHPYFAVTTTDGTFELRDVPVGVQTVRAWHEQYGDLSSSVRVEPGQVTAVDIWYPRK